MQFKQKTWRQTYWGQAVELALLLSLIFLIRTFGFGLYQVPSGSMETTMLVGERFFADKLSYWFRAPKRGEIIACNAPNFVYDTHPAKKLIQQYVWGPDNWTKRIIGQPGDHVRGVLEDGKPVVYVNGSKLDEPYLNSYPLLYLFKEGLPMTSDNIDSPRSYDSTKSFAEQPFYRMNQSLVVLDQEGKPFVIHPGTAQSKDEFDVTLGADEYWLMGDNRLGSHDSRWFGPIKRDIIHGRIVFRIWSIDSNESWWIFDLLKHPVDFWSRIRTNRFFQWIG